ncbi:hypothetical protein [Streptomyces sp. NPDC001292]|uniref:hypothetical protein n=1 Tax=Streptomyces sp. NPDC001292 TaxID=3364558 RepID=UPI0036D08A4F
MSSPHYQDVTLSVYVKIAALAARPEGCQAKTSTIASYLGLSVASVDRGMKQLRRPGPDGVVELRSERRTLPGGRGQSALRTVRPMTRAETFVWLPVAAAEDLTPRQLRAYALILFTEQRGIALTEGELAAGLRHHSGEKAGQAISVTAAGAIVDELEAARWVTVRRRAGAQGRHRYIAHDIAPAPVQSTPDVVPEEPGRAANGTSNETDPSQVGEGSGSPVDEGSLAYEESPKTDRPEDGRAFLAPAVGEVPVGMCAGVVYNPAGQTLPTEADGGLALPAGGNSQQPSPKSENEQRGSRDGGPTRPSYTGPQLAMSAQIYAVLEPVHLLLKRANNDFVVRKIAREVGRQLRQGMTAERLRYRLTARFAGVMLSDVRDPGRWLLGLALPRWGCGQLDCESGTTWSTGRRCNVCAEGVADRAAARQRAKRVGHGLCPEHGIRPDPVGTCSVCELDDVIRRPAAAPVPAPREPEGPARDYCGDCGARIFLTGHAIEDGLCKPCREDAAALASTAPAKLAAPARPDTCSGMDGSVPCGRAALPSRNVCARHRVQELAALRDGVEVSA